MPLLWRRCAPSAEYKPADKRRSLEPKPCRPESNPSSLPCSESKRTPMRPAALPGSRISETPETTRGSAELEFRIQFPPAKSHANHRFLSGGARIVEKLSPIVVSKAQNVDIGRDHEGEAAD